LRLVFVESMNSKHGTVQGRQLVCLSLNLPTKLSTSLCLIHLSSYSTLLLPYNSINSKPNECKIKSQIPVFICCILPIKRRQLIVLTDNDELIKSVLFPLALFLRAANDNYVNYNVLDLLLLLVLLPNDR
jgi:hypothetical protein